MAKKETAVLEEKVFTIPLRKDWLSVTRTRRTKKSVGALKKFISRHMHSEDVKISQKLSSALWKSGAKKPPSKVRVKASLDENGIVSVRLPEEMTLEEEKKKFLEDQKSAKKEGSAKEEKKGEAKAEELKPEEKKEERAAEAKDTEKKGKEETKPEGKAGKA